LLRVRLFWIGSGTGLPHLNYELALCVEFCSLGQQFVKHVSTVLKPGFVVFSALCDVCELLAFEFLDEVFGGFAVEVFPDCMFAALPLFFVQFLGDFWYG